MQRRIDLNADMGEGIGNDRALLDIVSSANVACGFHAGDQETMAATFKAAREKSVAIGAHPGFQDREGFGRTRQQLSPDALRNLITYQVGAAQGMAKAQGQSLCHLKLHGALANMASEDEDMARLCFQAALDVDPDLTIIVIAATTQQRAAESLGCSFACEIFADRAYTEAATLVDRKEKGAVIHDPTDAAARVAAMIKAGGIIAQTGKVVPTAIDTICVHGDTAEALEIAKAVRATLENLGIAIKPFG